MRWTLKAATDARGQSVRQRRVVLTPRCWRRRWQQYMAHRGERVISRKAIAQGMSDALRCPVCSCAHFLVTLHTRPRVQRAPGLPCTSHARGGKRAGTTRARRAARTHWHIRLSRPDTISDDNHPELSPVATVSPGGIFRRLPRGRRQARKKAGRRNANGERFDEMTQC